MTTAAHISRRSSSSLDAAAVRRSLVTGVLAALFSAAGLLVASPAAACSCAEADTATSFAAADAVFTGTLVSRDVDHPEWPVMSSTDPALHVFAVDGVFKGEVHELQGVVSSADGASCGLELSGDGPFVVFASRDAGLPEDQYRAGLCDGTTTLDPAIAAQLADLLVHVVARDADDLWRISEHLLAIPGVQRIDTALAMRRFVEHRVGPLLERSTGEG